MARSRPLTREEARRFETREAEAPPKPVKIPMGLTQALYILAQAHTREDEQVGYVVEMHPGFDMRPFSQGEYIEAWKVVRAALMLPTEPEHY